MRKYISVCIHNIFLIRCYYVNTYPFIYLDPNREKEEARENYKNVSMRLKELDSDLIIYCGNSGTLLQLILEEMMLIDYTPKGLLSGGTREYAFDRNVSNYITHVSLATEPPDGFAKGVYISNVHEYQEIFKKIFPHYVTDDPVYMYGFTGAFAGEILFNAIEASNSFDENDLAHAIRTEVYHSFLGEIKFSSNNGNINDGIAVQIANDRDNIFSPAIYSNATLIYPMPTWEERVESNKYHATEIVMMVILPLVIINSIGWIIYIYIKRYEKKIIASSPIFLLSMLIGKSFKYIYIYLIFFENLTNLIH